MCGFSICRLQINLVVVLIEPMGALKQEGILVVHIDVVAFLLATDFFT